MQLTKGMFGHEFGPRVDTPFKLTAGNLSFHGKIVHNGGWYSSAGDKLGWGDLGVDDIRRIQKNLEPGQVWVVLSESDSYWDFAARAEKYGTTPDAPGRQYVIDFAAFVITATEVYWVNRYSFRRDETVDYGDGVVCKVLQPEQVASVL